MIDDSVQICCRNRVDGARSLRGRFVGSRSVLMAAMHDDIELFLNRGSVKCTRNRFREGTPPALEGVQAIFITASQRGDQSLCDSICSQRQRNKKEGWVCGCTAWLLLRGCIPCNIRSSKPPSSHQDLWDAHVGAKGRGRRNLKYRSHWRTNPSPFLCHAFPGLLTRTNLGMCLRLDQTPRHNQHLRQEARLLGQLWRFK